jgi:hypothetical protein
MKKLILALIAAGSIATANAQSQSILLYGDLGLQTIRNSDLSKTTVWNASPGIGYQFNHNWTLGLSISWGQSAVKDSTGIKTTQNFYSVGPFARYTHFIGRSETFYWYSQADFDYQGGYTTSEGNPATDKNTGIYVGIYPALGINVGHGLCLNFNIGGINYATNKYAGAAYSTNTFNFSFGNQANIGISKNFNCGHKMHGNHEPGDEVHRRKADKMVEDEDDAAPKPKKKQRSRDDDE